MSTRFTQFHLSDIPSMILSILNPFPNEYINITHLFQFFSQFSCVISITAVNTKTAWKTVQILIRWLLQKPADLDLHRFLREYIQVQQEKVKIQETGTLSNSVDTRKMSISSESEPIDGSNLHRRSRRVRAIEVRLYLQIL